MSTRLFVCSLQLPLNCGTVFLLSIPSPILLLFFEAKSKLIVKSIGILVLFASNEANTFHEIWWTSYRFSEKLKMHLLVVW